MEFGLRGAAVQRGGTMGAAVVRLSGLLLFLLSCSSEFGHPAFRLVRVNRHDGTRGSLAHWQIWIFEQLEQRRDGWSCVSSHDAQALSGCDSCLCIGIAEVPH